MDNSNKPKMTPLANGESLKILEVTGQAGMDLPEHHSSQEAVVMVKKGSATLHLNGENSFLQTDKPFVIPAGARHSLHLEEDFIAWVTMAIDSTVKF